MFKGALMYEIHIKESRSKEPLPSYPALLPAEKDTTERYYI